uniref:U35-Austrotoxin-Ht1i_1 n=1 Tax=Hickmania troglodytes TaxID=489260 RepID=A0A482ZCH4_9ARAC
MKVILCLALFAFSLSYALNIEEKAAFDNLLEGFGSPNEEEARQKQCILRTHECTNNRHGCCRGEYMKDDCTCFYAEKTDPKAKDVEVCSCQQPWLSKALETAVRLYLKLKSGYPRLNIPAQ